MEGYIEKNFAKLLETKDLVRVQLDQNAYALCLRSKVPEYYSKKYLTNKTMLENISQDKLYRIFWSTIPGVKPYIGDKNPLLVSSYICNKTDSAKYISIFDIDIFDTEKVDLAKKTLKEDFEKLHEFASRLDQLSLRDITTNQN